MTSDKKTNISRICLVLGLLLVIASVCLIVVRFVSLDCNSQRNDEYADIIGSIIPTPRPAVLEERTDNTMPSLNIDGNDFCALIEMPAYGARLPIGSGWIKNAYFPCRFDGYAYDRSMIIGTSNAAGQLDFVKQISVGDSVYLTDMLGNRFSYAVSDIKYHEHAEGDAIYSDTADLVIFVKNVYDFEYIMLYCNAK